MNRGELRRYVGSTGHTLGHVEKDYLQHIVLAAFSRTMAGYLVFKGGTALQKLGVVARFSEDLDFTMTAPVEAERLRRAALQALQAYNYPAITDHEKEDERGTSFRLRIEGPLFNGHGDSLASLRVEVSQREDVLLPASRDEITPPYIDVMPYIISSMDLREVMAEKMRTLATRSKARDLYDTKILSDRGITVEMDLVGKKMEWAGETFDPKMVIVRTRSLRTGWDGELRSLMEDVPSFDEALSALEGLLESFEGADLD